MMHLIDTDCDFVNYYSQNNLCTIVLVDVVEVHDAVHEGVVDVNDHCEDVENFELCEYGTEDHDLVIVGIDTCLGVSDCIVYVEVVFQSVAPQILVYDVDVARGSHAVGVDMHGKDPHDSMLHWLVLSLVVQGQLFRDPFAVFISFLLHFF